MWLACHPAGDVDVVADSGHSKSESGNRHWSHRLPTVSSHVEPLHQIVNVIVLSLIDGKMRHSKVEGNFTQLWVFHSGGIACLHANSTEQAIKEHCQSAEMLSRLRRTDRGSQRKKESMSSCRRCCQEDGAVLPKGRPRYGSVVQRVYDRMSVSARWRIPGSLSGTRSSMAQWRWWRGWRSAKISKPLLMQISQMMVINRWNLPYRKGYLCTNVKLAHT